MLLLISFRFDLRVGFDGCGLFDFVFEFVVCFGFGRFVSCISFSFVFCYFICACVICHYYFDFMFLFIVGVLFCVTC